MGWTLVTGGAKRVGAEICRTLAHKGYDLVIHFNKSHREALHLVKECRRIGVKCECLQGDFSERETTERFVAAYLEHFSDTSHLINNVGNFLIQPAGKTSVGEWYDLFQTNLHAPFVLTHALLDSIVKAEGSIINIGTAGLDGSRADVYATAYALTKHTLWMLTRSLAKELSSQRVRVNMVSPGYLDISVDLPNDPSKLPMHRCGTPAEVARVVAFLMDKENGYITGQNIDVAGGLKL